MSMKPERFERELSYQTMLSISRRMLTNNLISDKEYTEIEQMLNEKYQPIFRAA